MLTIISIGASLSLLGILLALYHSFYFAELGVAAVHAQSRIARQSVAAVL